MRPAEPPELDGEQPDVGEPLEMEGGGAARHAEERRDLVPAQGLGAADDRRVDATSRRVGEDRDGGQVVAVAGLVGGHGLIVTLKAISIDKRIRPA